jgi:putative ABC transport system permease protein
VSRLLPTLAAIRHRPGRTLLTALGTALGIATIVALLAVSDGAQRSAGQLVSLGASDLGLFQRDATDPTTSILSTGLIRQLDQTPGIAAATPLLLLVQDVKQSPSTVVFGAEPGFETGRLVFSAGHLFRDRRQAVIGDGLAQQLHLRLGSTLTVSKHRLTVVGIYHIGISFEDTGAFIPLATAQSISARPGETTTIAVHLDSATKPAAAEKTINKRFPGLTIIADAQEAVRAGVNGLLVSKAALVIAVLSLVIGGIGVINTMLMSVLERRAEFALLSAVGWSPMQVARKVLLEGVATTVIGAAFGLLLGVLGAQLLVDILTVQAYVSPHVTAWALGRALLVGVLIGVLGGLYPAWRASRVSPAHVLAQN